MYPPFRSDQLWPRHKPYGWFCRAPSVPPPANAPQSPRRFRNLLPLPPRLHPCRSPFPFASNYRTASAARYARSAARLVTLTTLFRSASARAGKQRQCPTIRCSPAARAPGSLIPHRIGLRRRVACPPTMAPRPRKPKPKSRSSAAAIPACLAHVSSHVNTASGRSCWKRTVRVGVAAAATVASGHVALVQIPGQYQLIIESSMKSIREGIRCAR